MGPRRGGDLVFHIIYYAPFPPLSHALSSCPLPSPLHSTLLPYNTWLPLSLYLLVLLRDCVTVVCALMLFSLRWCPGWRLSDFVLEFPSDIITSSLESHRNI